jgi:hypothetical protein
MEIVGKEKVLERVKKAIELLEKGRDGHSYVIVTRPIIAKAA